MRWLLEISGYSLERFPGFGVKNVDPFDRDTSEFYLSFYGPSGWYREAGSGKAHWSGYTLTATWTAHALVGEFNSFVRGYIW